MTRISTKSLLLISAVLTLTGCGGGGGGGTGPSVPVLADPIVAPDVNLAIPDVLEPAPPSTPIAGVDYTDPSQFLQTTNIPLHLSQVNAQTAHNNGFTGGDLSLNTSYTTVASDTSNRDLQTIVAVIDTGINVNHEDFTSAGKLAGWKDFSSTNSLTPYDSNGHGTFVSHIIAGERQDQADTYYGIAYNSQILSAQVFEGGLTNNLLVKDAIDWVVTQKSSLDIPDSKKVVSVNLSIGTTDLSFINNSFETSLLSALNTGLNVVVAAGNEGLNCLPVAGSLDGQCGFPAAAPWVSSDTNSYLSADGGWIVVGSVDSNDNISSFSNKAGVTKSNYLVAPGEWIVSAANDQNDGYRVGSGTSFATPIVAGSLSLMAQKWPHLTGRQHTQILFDTATDLGVTGVDDVYGNGLLNLYDAFNPIGVVAIPTSLGNVFGSGVTQTYKSTQLKTSSSMAGLKSLTQLNDTIVLDSYNRDFKINLTNSIGSSGVAANDFENYVTMNFDQFLIGYEQYSKLPMFGYKFEDKTEVKFSYDSKTLLGMEGSGALSTGDASTLYLDLKKDLISAGDFKLSLSGSYAYGSADSAEGSIISKVSSVQAVGGNLKASYDGFGVGYKVPLRIVSGKISFNTPTDVDNHGNISYSSITGDLKPDSFEQTYSMFYKNNIGPVNLFAELAKTTDAFGVDGYINNEAKLLFSMTY